MVKWFRQLANIPGVEYAGNPGIDRSLLPGHNFRPTISTYDVEGEPRVSFRWKTVEGLSGAAASPAARWQTQPRPRETKGKTTLRQIHEALVLPGTYGDYSSALRKGIEELWKQRRSEPWVLPEIERFCWLSIQVAEADQKYSSLEGFPTHAFGEFGLLIKIYEREGNLQEALAVALRAEEFFQQKFLKSQEGVVGYISFLEELQPRMTRLELENEA